MNFPGFTRYMTGILVPVFSLRSKSSCACGEFLDLKLLADWCHQAALDIVQLLPVNDTGDDSSPYSALSAFALHPLYIRVQAIPEFCSLPEKVRTTFQETMLALDAASNERMRFKYRKAMEGKLSILEDIFNANQSRIAEDKEFGIWRRNNTWVQEYAAFKTLKRLHNNEGWQNWRPEFRFGNQDVVSRIWADHETGLKCLFHAWVQYRLEQQFLEASEYLHAHGIVLKGDIPIMMNEDSADIWAHGQNFHLELRAGAPPDMFSSLGQNWGFPIYDWEYLEAHGFEWWRQRLKQADKFYQAYRIDHVLGFFRIWTIDRHQTEGLLGYFCPSIFISRNDLFSIGFDEGRIKWLAEPHVSGWKVRDSFGMRSIEILGRCFNRIGNEDLYLFKPEIKGERDIRELPLMESEKNMLLDLMRNRALITVDENLYSPTWNFRECDRYQSLADAEKQAFEDIVARRAHESEVLWEKQGEKLLGFMKETVPMLTCAEDLGVVPDCVPRVLEKKAILGLKIPRWARLWKQTGQPFLPLDQYPFHSVCAPSVHDTSTLRDWWEHEGEAKGFWTALGFSGDAPANYDAAVARKVLEKIMECNSGICVLQIQELFACHEPYRVREAADERINIPGTIQPSNWSYRLPMTLEEIGADQRFARLVSDLTKSRRSKELPLV